LSYEENQIDGCASPPFAKGEGWQTVIHYGSKSQGITRSDSCHPPYENRAAWGTVILV